MENVRTIGRRVSVILAIWFMAALGIGISGVYYGVPAPIIGTTNVILVTLSLLLLLRFASFRDWWRTIPLSGLVLYHVVRLVGISFLVLHASGAIPNDFALKAGWGDIAVAVTAIPIALLATPADSTAKWWGVLLWNTFGLLDIVMVVSTAIRLGLQDLSEVIAITDFPMNLLPMFIVPLIFITHVLIYIRLFRERPS